MTSGSSSSTEDQVPATYAPGAGRPHSVIADRYRSLATAFTAKLAGVGAGMWDDPTPCTDWSVRDLVGHVVAMHEVHLLHAAAAGVFGGDGEGGRVASGEDGQVMDRTPAGFVGAGFVEGHVDCRDVGRKRAGVTERLDGRAIQARDRYDHQILERLIGQGRR